MKEFELIQTYFAGRGPKRKDVILGVGDDAALTKVPPDQLLVVATDTMVESVHFFPDASPRSIGHRALAVNLSDFAAMGAEPAWASVALTIPEINEEWLQGFSDGLFEIADYYNVQIIGGDTTRGPLSVTISLKGFVSEEKALRRSGAKAGDWICVTGQLGASALAVKSKIDGLKLDSPCLKNIEQRFNFPSARLAAGQVLRHAATSAIDVSDGFLQDLQHILTASNVSAELYIDKLPIDENVLASVDRLEAEKLALTGGEDYELIFTVPKEKKGYLEQNATAMGITFTKVGQIRKSGQGIKMLKNGECYTDVTSAGYQHFGNE